MRVMRLLRLQKIQEADSGHWTSPVMRVNNSGNVTVCDMYVRRMCITAGRERGFWQSIESGKLKLIRVQKHRSSLIKLGHGK